jgi:ubiquinone/menaquinone biosynthesis C-methylase UbiE
MRFHLLMDVEEFVTSNLPNPPCRILEVGCGAGELALALAHRGNTVTAIDPQAPEGPIFQTVSLEDFGGPGPFDAVVASTSLHHIHNLRAALDKINRLLRPGGVLILNEFGWERMDARTAGWAASHLSSSGDETVTADGFLKQWIDYHEDLHDSGTMRETLDAVFLPRAFEWLPFLAEHVLERPDLADEERALVDSGEINPLGFRYVGTPR